MLYFLQTNEHLVPPVKTPTPLILKVVLLPNLLKSSSFFMFCYVFSPWCSELCRKVKWPRIVCHRSCFWLDSEISNSLNGQSASRILPAPPDWKRHDVSLTRDASSFPIRIFLVIRSQQDRSFTTIIQIIIYYRPKKYITPQHTFYNSRTPVKR